MEKIDLSRFYQAHERDYQTALKEIKSGMKRSHWMWYIFPQFHGLGLSETSKYYSIKSLDEAKAFLDDDVLGSHLVEITKELLLLDQDDPRYVFGFPDDLKLKSSMTLFNRISEENNIFKKVLEKYYEDTEDEITLSLIGAV